jgi:hypothetical protein
MAQKKPTPNQEQWLKENYKKFKNAEIAERFTIPEYLVSVWLKNLGIKKIYKGSGKKRVPYRQRQFENSKINRVAGEYSNVTREQHVERILSMTI